MKNQFFSRLEWDTSQLLRKSLTSLRALTLLLVMCLSIGNVWGAWTDLSESLDLTGKSYGASGYNGTLAYGDWTIVNGANNSKGWAYFKMGGKKNTLSTANPCYIYYSANTGVSSQVDSITVHIPSGSLSKSGMSVNSWGVYVYSDKAMTSQVDYVAGGTISNAAADFGFKPSTGKTWAKAYYYKVSWDLANTTTTNGIVCVDKITLHANGGGGDTPDAPTFDPEDGTEFSESSLSVSISADEDIYYTLNTSFTSGADVFLEGTKYTEALNLTATTTIQAVAVDDNDQISEIANATYTKIALSAPNFTTQPVGASYEKDATPTDLSVVAEGAPSPAYQWYSNTKSSTEGASSISGATTASYTPSTATIGTTYYYCVATNSQGSATSDIVAVEVTAALPRVIITADSVTGLTTTYKEYTWHSSSVTGKMYSYKNNGMQFNTTKTGYYVYNDDAIPGNIRSIKMTTHSSGTEREWKVAVSTSKITSTSGTTIEAKTVAKAGTTWEITGSNKYFCLEAGGSSNISEIVVTYEVSTDPSIVVTPKPRHFEALSNASCDSVFNIAAEYLTGSMEAIIIGDNADKFSAGDIVDNKVAVTFTPGAIGNFSAKLVVKSMKSDVVEASDTVILTGEGLDSNIPVTGVTINTHALSLEKGATETLTATVTPDNASVKTVTWSSDNTEVATVDANGLVTAIKKGTANIIATSNNNIKDTCVLTVTLPAYWEKVTAAKDNWAGEYLLVYEDNNTAYVWTGIDNAQCYNDTTITDGQIMQPAGTVTVTLAAMDGGYSIQINGGANNGKYLSNGSKTTMSFGTTALAFTPSYATNCTQLKYNSTSNYLRFNSSSDQMRFRFYAESGQKAIQLYEKASTEPSVKLNKKSTSLSVGAKETLTATVKNSEATVVWSTLDDQVATVNNGEITAVAQGETKIIATITDAGVNYADTCVVTVTPAATVTSVTIDPEDATLYIYGTTPTKQTKNFTATVEGENEPAQTVTWKSLDEEVATVSEAGVVSAVAAGTTKIVAISTVDDTKSDTADVVVKVFENTAETAYTTAEAIELIDALGTNIQNIQVYVKGVVSQNDGLNSGAITYWLDENAFEVYKGKSFEGNNFSSADDIKVGDHVVVYGKLKKYNSTYEFDANSQLVSRKTAAVLAWSAGAYTAELGLSSYDYPTLTKTPSNIEGVVYESSNTEAATINAETGEIALVAVGNTTIKASFAGNDTLFAAQDATYELSVKAEVVRYTITYNSNGGSEIAPVADQTNLPATFPTPTKDFKVFGGWYFDNNVWEVAAVANMPLTKDTTLYAKWDEPKSITEMIALIPTSGDEVDNVYGWGYIKAGATVSSGYANYYITDGSDNDFYIYKGLNVNGESFTSADQLPSGNKVMIYGNIKNFRGTPEFDQGSRIINNAAVEVPVTGVSLNKAVAEVKVGNTITLVATIAPSHASNQNVSWSSNKESIATVDEDGVVTGVADGEATITVTTEEGGFQASCVVTVAAAPTFDNGIWVKVAATSELNKTDYYIIAANGYDYAMKSYESGNNCGAQDITKNGNLLIYATQPAIFQLEDGKNDNQFAIKDVFTEKYLYAAGTNTNNHLKAQDSKDNDQASWKMSVSEGVASIVAASSNRNTMSFNNGSSKIFSCYSAVQTNGALAMYKYLAGTYYISYEDGVGEEEIEVPEAQITDAQGKATVSSDEPVRTGYTFDGWQDADENEYTPGVEYTFTKNTVLTAQWTAKPVDKEITYDANGGTLKEGKSDPEGGMYSTGDIITLAEAVYEKADHIFRGWSDGIAETPYKAGSKYTVSTSVTMTAVWQSASETHWALVINEKQLKAGDKVIIVANGANYGLGAQHYEEDVNKYYRDRVEISKTSDKYYVNTLENAPSELIVGISNGKFTFNDGDGYLYPAGYATSKQNYIDVKEELDEGLWNVTIANGVATITSAVNEYVPLLQYNASASRFSCYNGAQGNGALAIYKYYETLPEYVERAMPSTLGTNCLAKGGVEEYAFSGATFYEILNKDADEKNVYFQEVVELVAGMPYIIQPVAGAEKVLMMVGGDEATAQNNNGLYGWLSADDTFDSQIDGKDVYFVSGGKIVRCGNQCTIKTNRAYIVLDEISGQVSEVPGRRRLTLGVDGKGVATGMEDAIIMSNGELKKVVIDGQFYILRDGKVFDAQGKLVK